ncbi:hypothetical protein DFH09DRAFT_1088257 [Mycena vulgaris]|nr:hypothetical protein DFH09DRAFT_1088257 [Mycena vulgaris]
MEAPAVEISQTNIQPEQLDNLSPTVLGAIEGPDKKPVQRDNNEPLLDRKPVEALRNAPPLDEEVKNPGKIIKFTGSCNLSTIRQLDGKSDVELVSLEKEEYIIQFPPGDVKMEATADGGIFKHEELTVAVRPKPNGSETPVALNSVVSGVAQSSNKVTSELVLHFSTREMTKMLQRCAVPSLLKPGSSSPGSAPHINNRAACTGEGLFWFM